MAKRKPNPAFMKPLKPSAALAEIVGSGPMPRTEVVSKMWKYIKKNGLQDKKDKKMIHCDAAMKAVMGKSSIDMFEMNKLLKKHLS